MTARPDQLDGPTYRVTLGDSSRMYVTINEHDGKPYEVFVRYDDPATYEWIAALTISFTQSLKDGYSLKSIGEGLLKIFGPESSHPIPGTSEMAPSIVARIGRVFVQHEEKFKPYRKKAAA